MILGSCHWDWDRENMMSLYQVYIRPGLEYAQSPRFQDWCLEKSRRGLSAWSATSDGEVDRIEASQSGRQETEGRRDHHLEADEWQAAWPALLHVLTENTGGSEGGH